MNVLGAHVTFQVRKRARERHLWYTKRNRSFSDRENRA